jgi:hypothetical protein
MLGFVGVGDWLLPGNFRLFSFPLFKEGAEHRKKFYQFYDQWRVFRLMVYAIAWAAVCFLRLGNSFILAAATLSMLQIVVFVWLAEAYARRSIGEM